MTEFAWLIERKSDNSWWSPSRYRDSGWTKDSLQAVRFVRKQDAEMVIKSNDVIFVNCSATEHGWGL